MKTGTIGITLMTLLGAVTAAQARTLVIGSQCTNPPYNYKDPQGAIKGFDIDMAQEIADRIGADLTTTCLPLESLIPALVNGQFDAIFASLSITAKRREAVDFTLPYRSATGRFVGQKGLDIHPFKDGKPDPAALAGKTIGVQRSTTHDTYMQAMYPDAVLNRYDSVESMLLDLRAGRIDLMLTSPIKSKTDFLDKPEGADYEFVGDEIISRQYLGEGVAAGVKKGNAELLNEINVAMKSMFEDGTFKRINLKYWNFSVMPEVWK